MVQLDQRKKPSAMRRVLFGIIIGASCVIGAALPPVMAVVPGILAFLAVGWGATSLFAAVLSISIAGYLLLGTTGTVYILLLNLPAAIAIAIVLLRRKPYRSAMVIAASMVSIALYAIVCLPGVLDGRGPAAGILDTVNSVRQNMMTNSLVNSASEELINEIFDTMEKTLPDLLVAGLALVGMTTAGISVLLCRFLARSAGARLRPMARLKRWRLGKGFTAGAGILLLGALAIVLMKFSYADSVMYVIQLVVTLPLMLQGIALLEYFSQRSKNAAVVRTLYVFAIVLIFPLSLIALASIGVMEQIFQIRRRFDDASHGGISS